MMVALNMNGAYDLTYSDISKYVTKTSAGNYALGNMKIDKVGRKIFDVKYVGRSDTDVAGRLKQHVGEKYKNFKYSYATSPKAAFEEECRNYHDFGETDSLDNNIHPRRPDGCGWKCPYCNVFN